MPIDELPVIGFCEVASNLYIALMHSGVTLAPLVGELATLEIADGARVEMLASYRPERVHKWIVKQQNVADHKKLSNRKRLKYDSSEGTARTVLGQISRRYVDRGGIYSRLWKTSTVNWT